MLGWDRSEGRDKGIGKVLRVRLQCCWSSGRRIAGHGVLME